MNLVVKCIAAKFLYGGLKIFEQRCFLIKIKTCENFYLYSFRNNYFIQKILVSSNRVYFLQSEVHLQGVCIKCHYI